MQLVQDDWETQIVLIAICLIIFGAHMIILFNIRVMMFMFVNKWSYMLPKSCSLLNLESLAYVEDICSPISTHALLVVVLRSTSNDMSFKYRSPHYCCVGIR
jgi:hypothetical protein